MARTKKEPEQIIYESTNEPIIISKITFDLLLDQKDSKNCIALYMFYYYTAKWQGTNQPKATTLFTAKALQCSPEIIRRTKKVLIDLGLIENIVKKDKNNKITGHYIKVKFIWKNEKLNESHPKVFPQCGKSGGKCLKSNYINYKKYIKKFSDFPFKDEWGKIILDWLEYKFDRKEKYKSTKSLIAFKTRLRKISNNDIKTAKKIIERSKYRNWAGIFPLPAEKKVNKTGFSNSSENYEVDGEC